ncbi:MAG TPA: ABC transporter permease [Anaerolineales bacterium]|nr:ABC transporter permease [Anaerolineales bacterium]
MRSGRLSGRKIFEPILAVLLGLACGALLILAAGVSPVSAYLAMFRAGFGCSLDGFCAILTALQYATPLILSGLSALVAFRAGFFSIGQAGQMMFGAGMATFAAGAIPLDGFPLPALALLAGLIGGGLYAIVPGVLKVRLGVNEVIVTLIFNVIVIALVAPVGFQRIPEAARLAPLVRGTKLNAGLFVAVAAAVLTYLYVWRSAGGFEIRMAGRAPRFARFGGVPDGRAVIRAVVISGGLAGLGGAIEVIGVQYRLVNQFSSIDEFDGIIVALVGQLQPAGVLLSALFLGGVRLGALNGLQLQAGIPRELGSALIALFVLLVSSPGLFRWLAGSPAAAPDA